MTRQAEKWRTHRREFELAVAYKITLREAREMLRRDARQLAEHRMRATIAAHAAPSLSAPIETPALKPHEEFDARWMMRN